MTGEGEQFQKWDAAQESTEWREEESEEQGVGAGERSEGVVEGGCLCGPLIIIFIILILRVPLPLLSFGWR